MEEDIKEISPEEAREYIAKGAVVIDVRTVDEFKEGHIPGAVNIDIYSDSFVDEIKKLDASKKYLICCASGARSLRACGIMKNEGITDVCNLAGGMTRWKSEGGEVEHG